MSITIKRGALLATLLGALQPALADQAETRGGFTIKTDDGRFEARLGGRIHFDANVFVDDDDLPPPGETGSTYFRRARLTLEGRMDDWKYKFEEDFTGAGAAGIREMWLGRSLSDVNVRVGQAKPYRGMEELTSSNEIVFMERPYATATGLYEGRQYQQGLFVDTRAGITTWGVALYNLRSAGTAETNGVGGAARVTVAPVATETAVVHLGLSGSHDKPQYNSTAPAGAQEVEVGAKPAGRLTSTETIHASEDAQTTVALEAAGKAGPFYVQAEAAQARFDEPAEPEVITYYVQASYFVTGESKPYDAKKGVFKSPKPQGGCGALELKARYDFIENKDVPSLEVSQVIVGANWYANPHARFMLEYIMGTNEFDAAADGSQGVDLATVAARAQVNF